jgi:MoxR-like ATPase
VLETIPLPTVSPRQQADARPVSAVPGSGVSAALPGSGAPAYAGPSSWPAPATGASGERPA